MLPRSLLRAVAAPAATSRATVPSLQAGLTPPRRFASSTSKPPAPASVSPRSSSAAPTASTSKASTSHLTPEEAEAKQLEEADTKPPPYLSRALGVKEPPTKGKPSREEWRANLLSQERRLKERRHLVKQVSKGYFHDYNELRHQGGKSWIAPNTLIREDLSLYFPDIEGTSLADRSKTHTTDLFPGKISLVVMSSFRSSEEHINSFVRPALSDMKDESLFQYVYINLQENPLKSFLVNMFLSSLRKTIPVEQQPTYLLSHQSLEYLREPMGMQNKHVGYVFLVDWERRIRWAGCSWATLDEEEALRKCSHVLVRRLQEINQ